MEICGENMRKIRRNSKLCVLLEMKRTCYILQVLAQFIILIRQCLAIDVVCQQVGRNGKKKGNRSENICKSAEKMVRTLQSYDEYTEGKFHDICLIRESQQLYMRLMLSEKAKELLKSENREMFNKLSLKRKVATMAACCMPPIVYAIYRNRLFEKNY